MTGLQTAGLRNIRLPDGRRILIRPILPDDTTLLADMGKLCSAQDLRFRFLHTVGEGDEKALRSLTELDPRREIAFVAFNPGDPVPVAVVRLHGEPDGKRAEFAILVRSDNQGVGLGRVLMRFIIGCARERGLRVLYAQVLLDNERLLNLSRSLGFSRAIGASGVTEIELDLDPEKAAGHLLSSGAPAPDIFSRPTPPRQGSFR